MEVQAKAKFLRVSPKKLAVVAAGIRRLSPEEALTRLKFSNLAAGRVLARVIKQAIANAKSRAKAKPGKLVFKRIEINEGPRLKRMDKSHGARFDRGVIQKRTSMIKVQLTEVAEEENGAKS